ncbi:MAG: hypothetical protein DRG83_22125 [Deltaproteobacteria bacterium]|nr:MAG: hypothetical protein DRG83_22125 [Deltaproteobacteria bacterium]
MPVVRELYVDEDTFIHRLDPRVKIISVILSMILGVLLHDVLSLFLFYCFLISLMVWSKVGWKNFIFGVKTIAPVTILIFVLSPISFPGGEPVIAVLGPLTISLQSFLKGAEFVLRINTMAFSVYFLLFTTSQRDLVYGLVKMGLPYNYGLTLTMALRYIPTFGAMIGMITDSQKARGLELEKGNFLRKARKYVAVAAPTMINALRMADQLSIAIASRGFGAKAERTFFRELRVSKLDIVTFVLVIIVFIMIVLFYCMGVRLFNI